MEGGTGRYPAAAAAAAVVVVVAGSAAEQVIGAGNALVD